LPQTSGRVAVSLLFPLFLRAFLSPPFFVTDLRFAFLLRTHCFPFLSRANSCSSDQLFFGHREGLKPPFLPLSVLTTLVVFPPPRSHGPTAVLQCLVAGSVRRGVVVAGFPILQSQAPLPSLRSSGPLFFFRALAQGLLLALSFSSFSCRATRVLL